MITSPSFVEAVNLVRATSGFLVVAIICLEVAERVRCGRAGSGAAVHVQAALVCRIAVRGAEQVRDQFEGRAEPVDDPVLGKVVEMTSFAPVLGPVEHGRTHRVVDINSLTASLRPRPSASTT